MKLPDEPNFIIFAPQPGYAGDQPFVPISDYRRLHSLCEQLKEDAERYRWLRQHPIFLGWDEDYSDSGIDREVDAARKESDDKA